MMSCIDVEIVVQFEKQKKKKNFGSKKFIECFFSCFLVRKCMNQAVILAALAPQSAVLHLIKFAPQILRILKFYDLQDSL